ncbi:hypothetical protein D9757_000808 [Collybiopsis confluens]|uniref:Uncharacterized protein n=1 Tax=Collybiopsis confluens TaxID=2823264 RepID=A0A8H5I0I2_9AGAR|nr:hypothetical protein D9757_000808 [Collybiopsis confluens]
MVTWDKDLIYNVGQAIGAEHYDLGFNAFNGPISAPMGRSPWEGKLFFCRTTNPLDQTPILTEQALGFGRVLAGATSWSSITIGQASPV